MYAEPRVSIISVCVALSFQVEVPQGGHCPDQTVSPLATARESVKICVLGTVVLMASGRARHTTTNSAKQALLDGGYATSREARHSCPVVSRGFTTVRPALTVSSCQRARG